MRKAFPLGRPAQQQGSNGNAVQKPSTFTLNNSIINASYTTAAPGMILGGIIGEAIEPVGGGVVGALLGSTIGVGGSASYVPGSDSTYIGATLTFTPRLLGGEGGNISWQFASNSFKADNIASGFSFSGNVQPTLLGAAGSWSPGNGWAAGPSVGTRVPVSVGVSYNFNFSSITRPIEHWISSLFQ